MSDPLFSNILIISLLILSSFFLVVFFVVANSAAQKSQHVCAVGQCAMNIATGVKRDCGDSVPYDIASEVCVSEFTCDNPTYPYAVLQDGYTVTSPVFNGYSMCPNGIRCNCRANPQCAYYETAYFQTSQGSSSTIGQTGNRAILQQIPQDTKNPTPMKITDHNTQTCEIGAYSLSSVWPPLILTGPVPQCSNGSVLGIIPDRITGTIPALPSQRAFACINPSTDPVPTCPTGTNVNAVINLSTGKTQYQCL